MPLDIRNEAVNELAETLASRTGVSKTEAVRSALAEAIDRLDQEIPLADRLRPLLDEIDAVPRTGLEADKAFYDSLNGE